MTLSSAIAAALAAAQPPALVSEIVAERPQAHASDPLSIGERALLNAHARGLSPRDCLAAACLAMASADLARIVRVSGKGKQARKQRGKRARAGRSLLAELAAAA